MKVRIGYGLGTRTGTNDYERFCALVDGLEDRGFDSLWLSERIGGNCPDPLVGMSMAVGRTRRLKVGMSVMVLPGRNPVVLAKSMASLDRLSDGRVLPAFGLGIADSAEHQAFGVDRRDRGGWFNEALPLMQRLWTEDGVHHDGKRFKLNDVTVGVKPVQQPLEVWLGGISPLELRRVGRLAHGWLPSFCTAGQVAEARVEIEAEAKAHGRQIDEQHFGALIPYRSGEGAIPEPMAELVARRNPNADIEEVMPRLGRLPEVIAGFVGVGFSKFVLIPVTEPGDWAEELDRVASVALPLET